MIRNTKAGKGAKARVPPPDFVTLSAEAREATKNFVRLLKKCRDYYEKGWRDRLRTTKYHEEMDEVNKYSCPNCSCPNCLVKRVQKQHGNKQPEANGNLVDNQNVPSTSKCVEELEQSVMEILPECSSSKTNATAENKENETNASSEKVLEMVQSPVLSLSRRKRKKATDPVEANSSSNSIKVMSSFHNIFDDAAFEEAMCKAVPDSTQVKTHPVEDNDSDRAISPTQIVEKRPKVCRQLTLGTSRGLAMKEVTSDRRKLKQTKLAVLEPPKSNTDRLFDEDFMEGFKEDWKEEDVWKKVDQNTSPNKQGTTGIPSTSKKSFNKNASSSTVTPIKQKLDHRIPSSPLSTPMRNFPACSKSAPKENEKPTSETVDMPTFFENDATYFARDETLQNNVKAPEEDGEKLEELNFNLTQDETFFTMAEMQMKEKKMQEKAGGSKKLPIQVWKLVQDFDVVPGNKEKSPERPYKGKAVRNKNERQKLEGWDCWECEKFYEGLDYTEEELRQHKKKCSRHRSKFQEKYNTPPGFWNPVFTNTVGPSSKED